MALLELSAGNFNRLAGATLPSEDPYYGQDIVSTLERAADFLQHIEFDDPNALVHALRTQSHDFVTAMLDIIGRADISEEYMPINHPLLCTLVGDFGWKMTALFPAEDPDFPNQEYTIRRPSRSREDRYRTVAMRTQNIARQPLAEDMAAVRREAMDFLSANQENAAEIIHALKTRKDDFVEAAFDIIEADIRTVWVSPHHPLIRYLLDEVGWLRGATTGTSAPWGIMIRPAHHTLQELHDGVWTAASWELRAMARRAWDSGEIGEGESYQSWYQAYSQAIEARTSKAWALDAEVFAGPSKRGRGGLARSIRPKGRQGAYTGLEIGEGGVNIRKGRVPFRPRQ